MKRIARIVRRTSHGLAASLVAIGKARLARGDDAPARAARLSAALAEVAAIHGLVIETRGAWPEGPAVIVANHVSYLDPMAIVALRPCAPISKGEKSVQEAVSAATPAVNTVLARK